MPARPIAILNEDPALRFSQAALRHCLRTLDAFPRFAIPCGTLSIRFVLPSVSASLHQAFFNDPSPTDVMTFPGDPADHIAGDVAICPAIAAQAATEFAQPFALELALYTVHAWLHLAGLRDDAPAQRAAMRAAESHALDFLRQHNALPDFAYRP